jgi:putative hydrolase of HD superfamily
MRTAHRENVAEHSFFVALIADWLVADLGREDVDVAKVMRMALYHDIEEAYTGDLVTPVKYRSATLLKEWEQLCTEMLSEGLCSDFAHSPKVSTRALHVHTEYEREKMMTIEGQIVKFADMLQSAVYLLREIQSGNQHICNVLRNVMATIHKLFDPLPAWECYLSQLDVLVSEVDSSPKKVYS